MARQPYIVARFGGLNTELAVNKLRSGTGRVSRNTTLTAGVLSGRAGFAEFDANAGSLHACLSAAVFPNASGDIYLMVKRNETATAGIDYALIYNATTRANVAASWTDMADQWSGHVVTERGWWFTHKDRLHHCDHAGMSKWHVTPNYKPDATTAGSFTNGTPARAWKGGIRCDIGPVLAAAETGAKHGHYFMGAVKRNSTTGELSCIQDLQATSCEVDQAASKGSISISNAGIAAAGGLQLYTNDLAYEWDEIQIVSSTGGNENAFGADSWTQQMYVDVCIDRGDASAGSKISDATLRTRNRHTNSGGAAIPAQHGAYNGARAVYGGCYLSTALVPGQIAFSLQGFPCMVPGDQTYTAGGVSLTWAAEPYNGFINAGVSGRCQAIRPVGNRFVVFTDATSFWLSPLPNGSLYPTATGVAGGCCADECAVATPSGAYSLGAEVMMWAAAGVRNVAQDQFTPTLKAVPAAYRHQCCGAFYSPRREVWWAVPRTPYSCNSLLVHDSSQGNSGWATIAASLRTSTTYSYQVFPDSPANNDAAYLIWTAKPTAIAAALAVGQAALYTSTACIAVEYWNGSAWATLTVTGDTTNPDDATGGCPLADDGTISAASPSDWASTTVGSGTTATGFAIRLRVAAGKGASITRVPILANHGPTRVLIYDESLGTLTGMYDPRNLRGAYIAWMCELARPTDSPAKMLLFLSDGRILYWPSASFADTAGAVSCNYSTEWEGYFGQEYRHREASDMICTIHTGTMARRVNVAVTGLKTGAEDLDATDATMEGSNDVLIEGIAWDAYRSGKLFKVRISTTASELADSADVANSPEWEVVDVILKTSTD